MQQGRNRGATAVQQRCNRGATGVQQGRNRGATEEHLVGAEAGEEGVAVAAHDVEKGDREVHRQRVRNVAVQLVVPARAHVTCANPNPKRNVAVQLVARAVSTYATC